MKSALVVLAIAGWAALCGWVVWRFPPLYPCAPCPPQCERSEQYWQPMYKGGYMATRRWCDESCRAADCERARAKLRDEEG